ncbi:hypothetical protein ACNE9Y_30380 [Pseudomonas sp. NY11226]|uniref:hypothetical protein n=1 Tax=unclassified Pseudomonas TaxID=196821 RepID=UPI0031F60A47
MTTTTYLEQAQQFAAEMVELVMVHKDGDEPDERYQQFVEEFAKKIIGETSLHLTLDQFRDLRQALQLVSKIESYNGETFEGNIDSYLDSAILHVMKPIRSLSAMLEDGEDENKEIMVHGVKMTIAQAIFIFEHIDAISANISLNLFYKGEVETDDISSENLGYNLIQKPRDL